MRRQNWRSRRKRVAKRLLPLFAPLILSPVAAPVGTSAAKSGNAKNLKGRVADFKMVQFEQVAHGIYEQMELQQQGLRFEVFDKALTGYFNLKREGKLSDKQVLTIVDFTKSSTKKRLWVLDLEKKQVLYNTYVAHGRNSGNEYAESFSNDDKSYMSSIGFYVTQETYKGKHGLSLRLDGLDEAFNSNALDRCVVMHGAEYASEAFINQTGRLGRSLGCPALPMDQHEDIISTVMGKTTLYIHAANDAYTSQYLDHASAMAELLQEEQPNLPSETGPSI
jgi:hypothetical protein